MVRGRVLAAGLVVLGAGCAFLGWSSPRTGSPHATSTSALTFASGGVPTLLAGAANSPSANLDAKKLEAQAQARSVFGGLPLSFEPNQGQGNLDASDPRAKFVSRGSGYSLFLGSEGAILSMASVKPGSLEHLKKITSLHPTVPASVTQVESLEMKLAGANPNTQLSASDPLPGKSNYFIGNDASKWRAGVPQFARVRYENVYPGINLVFYGNQGRLEYDFQVAPGADPAQAELEFNGAKRVELRNGALLITSQEQSVQLQAPVVYQEIGGQRHPVEGHFVLRGKNRAGFAIGDYDRSRELVIDPILTFSTYFGGSGDELATSVAVDGSFNIYLTGSTTSPNLPTTASVKQPTIGGAGPNVYIAKITPPLGSLNASLVYVTYLGGTGQDSPVGIGVDGAGDAYVAGTTSSPNFPTNASTAYQSAPVANSPGPHVFVSELSSDASTLLYSSYLSGDGTDLASGMAIDPAGEIYVTGTTTSSAGSSPQFPASTLPNKLPFQMLPVGPIQFFVSKINTAAPGIASLPYSTYFGGANFTAPTGTAPCGEAGTNPSNLPCVTGGGIAVDTNLNVYFSGTTNFLYTGCSGCSSTDFPILDAYQPCLGTPPATVIVNPPTCTYATPMTAPDAFVAKLNPNAQQGEQLLWSTYLGGANIDSSAAVAVDNGATHVYVIGTTNSQPFVNASLVTTFAPYQECLNNLFTPPVSPTSCTTQTSATTPSDAFVAALSNPANASGTVNPVNVALTYFSYLGGLDNETGLAITVDTNSGAVVTGSTQSPYSATVGGGSFPVSPYPNSIQSNLTGAQDAFVARLNTAATVGQTTAASWANYFGGSTTSGGAASTTTGSGIALDVNQNTYLAGSTNAIDFPVAKPVQATNNGGYDAFATQLSTALSMSITGVLSLGSGQTYISAGNQATFTYTITNNGPDLASGIVVTDNLLPSVTGIAVTFDSASISTGLCSAPGSISTSVSCGPISLQSGSTATVTIVLTPTPNTNGTSPESFNGGTVQVIAPGNIVLAQTFVPAYMSDFKMAVNPFNQSVAQAGDTASYQVQLTPSPLYGSSISLTCAGLPTGTSCTFNPTSTTLQSSSGQTVSLSIVTTARPITTTTELFGPRGFYAGWLVIPGLALVGIGGGGRRRRWRIAGTLMISAIFAMLLILPACTHSSTQAPVSGTPAGNYNITVTATSGSDSKSQSIGLNVP